jgi:flavorubredoxin
MEPDHSAAIPDLTARYPEMKIVCNAKTSGFINQFCDIDICITILSVQISIKTQSTLIFSVILYFFAYIFFNSPLKE